MKRKDKEHEEALRLRKLGWSYSAIKNELNLSKSTLSVWLRNYPLSKGQILKLQHSEAAKEKFRETMRSKRKSRMKDVYMSEMKIISKLNKRELYIAGLMMYWGEGLKATSCTVCVANTDPAVMLFTKKWLKDCYKVREKDFRVKLHLYSDMNYEEASEYWSRLLGVPREQFIKPYIKESRMSKLTEKGLYGHGTCNLMIYNTRIKERVMMGIDVIKKQFG